MIEDIIFDEADAFVPGLIPLVVFVKATLVLGSIRCPRTVRNANEKGEPFGVEAATFISRLVFQRDVEVMFDNCDKTRGEIFEKIVAARKNNRGADQD